MSEFYLVDQAASLYERSSGCKLHRDPVSGKCQVLPLGRWRSTLQQEDIKYPYMKLSNSLAMVGVELTACWMRTRQVNCDELRKRVQNTVGAWRSGKFNPLVSRSCSLNAYCLSKIWFRTHSVDIRSKDIDFLHTKCRSYMFQDMLLKPAELVIFRPADQGGLGLHHVRSKASANLIATFLQTAANSRYISSQFHVTLYRYHVLEEQDVPNPGFTPYYTKAFFDLIKKVLMKSPLNPVQMTVGQWYVYLLEENVTMTEDQEGRREAKKCRVEEQKPDMVWGRSYRLARTKGLSPEHKSFLFKVLHHLLPTGERVNRIQPEKSSACRLCRAAPEDTLLHAFYSCEANKTAAEIMLRCAQVYAPSLTPEGSLYLELEVQDPFALPTVTILVTGLELIWCNRMKSSVTNIASMKAELEARAGLLQQTRGRRLREAGAIMANILVTSM